MDTNDEPVITKEHILRYWTYRNNGLYKVNSGTRFGNCTARSGRLGTLFRLPCYEHEVVYFIHHNIWPQFVMHLDGNPNNNNIDNISVWGEITATTPWRARSLKSQYSDIKGVYPIGHYADGRIRYQATIKVRNKLITLYCGDNYLQAVSLRKQAELEFAKLRKSYPDDLLEVIKKLSEIAKFNDLCKDQ